MNNRSGAQMRTASGRDPVGMVLQLAKDAKVSRGDMLYAIERQKSAILQRTAAGRDANGRAFEPYDTSRPYYHNPSGGDRAHGRTPKQLQAAAKRWQKRIGGTLSRTGRTVKYASYSAFKAAMGRATVDLFGPRAPHMLQALMTRVGGMRFGIYGQQEPGLRDMPEPATEARLGIYGTEAGRAAAHNTGVNPRWKRKHQRLFLATSATDVRRMCQDIVDRAWRRLQARHPL